MISSVEIGRIKKKSVRLQPLSKWLNFSNFATIVFVSYLILKISKAILNLCERFFSFTKIIENPKILVVGPKKEIVEEIIFHLSRKFDSELIDFQNVNPNSFEIQSWAKLKSEKSILLYSHAPVGSQEEIAGLSVSVEKICNHVDILVIAQQEEETNSNRTFFNYVNNDLLPQFWVVMAFLPGMLRRNNGHIVAIALGESTLLNTGLIGAIYEDLIQTETKVKMTLIERNSFLENFIPSSYSSALLARLIVRSMWSYNSVVRIPSLSNCLLILSVWMMKTLMNPMAAIANLN